MRFPVSLFFRSLQRATCRWLIPLSAKNALRAAQIVLPIQSTRRRKTSEQVPDCAVLPSGRLALDCTNTNADLKGCTDS